MFNLNSPPQSVDSPEPANATLSPRVSWSTRIGQVLILSMLVALGGWLGLRMVIPPGYASPLWPPTGIALAALLIWGKQLWPGVWFGSLISQFVAVSSFAEQFTLLEVLSSAIIAGGSTLQTLVAVNLSEKLLSPGLPKLDNPRTILLFFMLTAPVAGVISPTLGTVSIYLLDILSPAQLWISWRNWWIGDSLGVMIITPLIFCFFGKPREVWVSRRISVALPLLGVLLVLVLVFVQVFRAEQARIQQAFDNQAATIDRLLVEYADNIVDSTLALTDVYLAAHDVNREEFAIFSQGILRRHPEIQALEWLPRVTAANLSAFEAQIRAEGYPDFHVTEQSGNELIAAHHRSEYFPILYVEPMAGNEKAFGLDSASNPVSRQAKEYARQRGKPTASQQISLLQRPDKAVAILVSVPVFKKASGASADDFAGFVSAVILPAKMMDIVTKDLDGASLGLKLEDLNAPQGESELFSRAETNSYAHDYVLKKWQRRFPFADRTWQISIAPDSRFIFAHGSTLPWITLLGGLFLTSLLSILLLIVSGKAAYVEALVEKRTQELEKAITKLRASASRARESELKLRTIVESEPECVKLLAADGHVLQMNRAGLEMFEVDTLEQAQHIQLDELILPKYQVAYQQLRQQVFAGIPGTLEFEIRGLKGGRRWLDTHSVPMRDSSGQITALLGLTRDITERKRTEEHLRLAARVFSEAHEGILITDATASIIDVNPTFCSITGYSREEIIGQNPSILQSGKHGTEFFTALWDSLLEKQHWQGELWNRKKNGELYAERLTISALCDGDGVISHYVGLISDVTQAKQQQQMLELVAHYDPLTRLPNRILFADRLTQAIAHSKREKSLLAICFLDLDGFKPVNDQFGHDVGDQVLVEVAERIKSNIREEDSISRHGGDEFVLLLRDIESVEQCEHAIMRIHDAIAIPYFIDDQPVMVGASSGYTIFPLDDADPDTLLRHADHAMYQAKLAGKNCYRQFDTNKDQQIIHHHQQLRDIEAAFFNNELCLYYQPKINIKTGLVCGVEALLRWQHPQLGMVPPMDFLPVIASTELEVLVGNWVITQACQQLSIWQTQGLHLEVSVNISSYHLLWPGLSDHIEQTLCLYPSIESGFLQLEILESTALDDLTAVNRIVENCRDHLGISIALDDFGTGYSSLTHLRHLSVDTVKIDQTFVRDMLDDPDDYAIVESVISLSQAFRREVIAEGVESKEQGIVLLLLGCHLLQGYAISRPMPGDKIVDWVAAYQPYEEWRHYAQAELSPEQTMIEIRRFDMQQWLQRIQQCLFMESPKSGDWPMMDHRKCHLGRWLKKTKYDKQYGDDWLNQIEALHRERYRVAKRLKQQFETGFIADARTEFAHLEAIQQQLDERLTLHAQFSRL